MLTLWFCSSLHSFTIRAPKLDPVPRRWSTRWRDRPLSRRARDWCKVWPPDVRVISAYWCGTHHHNAWANLTCYWQGYGRRQLLLVFTIRCFKRSENCLSVQLPCSAAVHESPYNPSKEGDQVFFKDAPFSSISDFLGFPPSDYLSSDCCQLCIFSHYLHERAYISCTTRGVTGIKAKGFEWLVIDTYRDIY